ncbi:MAG: endonuclease VII domain-containing protein [Thaumarchaeota archaeon]|nr:endonuclease VII domain-containing protein [Nitrososphaerota archaeon]
MKTPKWNEPGYSTARVHKWREENPEKAEHSQKRYYRKNKATILARGKGRYKKAPKKVIKRSAKWREKNYDRMRDRTYQRKYGITLEQYNKMLEKQGGVCVLCKKPPVSMRLAVDHCHRDKRVRGLACFRCNKYLIGRWKKEHAAILRLAADYLESEFDGRHI